MWDELAFPAVSWSLVHSLLWKIRKRILSQFLLLNNNNNTLSSVNGCDFTVDNCMNIASTHFPIQSPTTTNSSSDFTLEEMFHNWILSYQHHHYQKNKNGDGEKEMIMRFLIDSSCFSAPNQAPLFYHGIEASWKKGTRIWSKR